MAVKNSHCGYCGHAFADPQGPWPRSCPACHKVSYINPLPVAVLVLPVDDGVLTVRRGFGSAKGKLAFPGGFIDLGETWQQAAARELQEEASVEVAAEDITHLRTLSAPDGTLLVFGRGPKLSAAELPDFVPNSEVLERVIIGSAQDLAFPLHSQVLFEFFQR